MALNASIFGNMLNAPKSPEEYAVERRQNMLGQLQYKQALQQQADDQAYRDTVKSFGSDQTANYNALLGKGLVNQAMAYQKAGLETKKTQAEIDKSAAQTAEAQAKTQGTQYDLSRKKIEHGVMSLVASSNPDIARQKINDGVAQGMWGMNDAQQMLQELPNDPAGYQDWRIRQMNKLLSANDSLNQIRQDKEFGLKQNQFGETVRHNKSTEGIQLTGIRLADSRAREATQATMSKPFEVTGADGQPVLVQQDKQGNIRPVQGYSPKTATDKPLNDSQAKSLLFGSRAREADKVLGDLALSGTTSSVPGSRAPVIGGVISALQGGSQQSLDQAKRDFMTAVLRRESGASISPSEFDTADKQYFPQIGDSPQVIKQKAANRRLVIDGILSEVPEKQRGTLSAPTQSNQGPKVGAIEDGHRFKGGDPSNPSNWEKVK